MKKTQFKSYDNSTAPIKDNITKTSFKMTFSKSNFMFIGKWIIAFVLIIVFGSQALKGFISSKFTKDSTSETIVHEYKKQIGTEMSGGNFNFINSIDDYNLLFNKKIYLKRLEEGPHYSYYSFNGNYLNSFTNGTGLIINNGVTISFYDDNHNLVYSQNIQSYNSFYFCYINQYRNLYIINGGGTMLYYFFSSIMDSNNYVTFGINSLTNVYNNSSYFVLTPKTNTTFYCSDEVYPLYLKYILNELFVLEPIITPIYETTTYTYEVKDNNYNWDLKLKQLSSFKPLFKFNQSFINEDYVKYSNLISYEFVDTESSRENLVNQYKLDERLKVLFDNNYISISGKTESGIFKDKTKFYSYIKINYPLDYDIQGVSSAYNWVIDNYVTDFNIDSYLTESKYKIELKDLLEIFKFPFQIVNNLVYNFGVLIGFITWW